MMRPTNATTTTMLSKLFRTCVMTCYDNCEMQIQHNRRYLQTSCKTLTFDNRPAATAAASMQQRRQQHSLAAYEGNDRRLLKQQQQNAQYSKMTYLNINKDNAQELVCNLTDTEREAIKDAIDKYESFQMKKDLEGQLAAVQWRTRFGRLSRVPALGDVDPTGTFCAFPDDWLRNKLVQNAKPPAFSDLYRIFVVNAAPFIVFGFLDNFSMIIAGDWIEYALGLYMPISTMAAAGLGNTISDILGLGSAFYVERGCILIGLKPPKLTPAQFDLKSSRRASNNGRLFGITLGCIIGMFPLLFMDSKEQKKEDSLTLKTTDNTTADATATIKDA